MLYDLVRSTVYPVLSVGHKAMGLPIPYGAVERIAKLGPAPYGVIRERIRLPNASAELIRAAGVHDGSRAVLYCHGGGFLFCGINTHLHVINRLSRGAGCPVLAVDYRMLPRNSVADAVDDCLDGLRWLVDSGIPAGNIAVAGDSAGGYLAMTVAQAAQRIGMAPASVAMLSPLLQLDGAREARHGPMIPHSALTALTDLVAAADPDLYEPLEHVETGFPPTLIHVSGAEELLHDAQRAGKALSAAGSPVEVVVWPGQVHVFQVAAGFVREGRKSLHQIADFIRETTSARTVSPGWEAVAAG